MDPINEKQCSRCRNKFPATLEYFQSNKASKDGLYSLCKDCKATYKTKYRKKRKINIRNFLKNYKNRPCAICGNKYPYYVMDFHHRDKNTKADNISQMICIGYSVESILNEVEKCDVVCSNCHRILTWGNESDC